MEKTQRGRHPLQLQGSSELKACEWNPSVMAMIYRVANETCLLTLPVTLLIQGFMPWLQVLC